MAKTPESWNQATAVLLAVLLSGLTCQRPERLEVKPPGAPPITGTQLGLLPPGGRSLTSVRTYAESLEFNTAPPQADRQPVDFVRDTVGIGNDTVRIEPVSGASLFDTTELAQGRIVGRIWSTREYRPLGFGPWWTYWWIDRSGGTWRTVFISRDTLARGELLHHKEYWCDVGRTCARIRMGSDVMICYNCGGTWCKTPLVTSLTASPK